MNTIDTKRNIWNRSASISIDLFGGAITDFHLKGYRLNPLSFRFTPEQMPANNRAGAVYQGHFLCLGRWGGPSAGEVNNGMPNHGQFANIMWEECNKDLLRLEIKATGGLEGLSVHRYMQLDQSHPAYVVHEEVTNISKLGRMYNMVQHPTLSAPFLDKDVMIDCNATMGYDYLFDEFSGKSFGQWPRVLCKNQHFIDISSCIEPYSSVFSFIVDPQESFGWITAFSPSHELLLGYLWKRQDYPWINHWVHWDDQTLLYRGIEFGTTGLHKPFEEILRRQLLEVLGEKTYSYLDAGESCSRSYLSFLQTVQKDFRGIADVKCIDQALRIVEKETNKIIHVPVSLNF